MLILGIDTSCDDTAAAVVQDGSVIKSNIVSNQNEIHQKYGGIVPELASRKHLEMIWPVVHEAMGSADVDFKDLSAVAVCQGPGLIGSLLVGVCFGKSLSYVNDLPLIAVNHLEGHIFSAFLEDNTPEFPFIALVVSGGHTSIYRVNGFDDYKEISRTRDDAAGEAFDKVAKLLDLGYPGGPLIEQLALKGDAESIPFPRAIMPTSLDFSYSGLKTAVLTHIKKKTGSSKEDIAASFQAAALEMLIKKTIKAAGQEGINRISVSGGVSANSLLRKKMKERAAAEGIEVYLPSLNLSTDNAAMIAAAGFHHFNKRQFSNYSLNPRAYMPL